MKVAEEVRIESQVEKQQPDKLTFLGSERVHPGHTCFELNLKTGEVLPATVEENITAQFGQRITDNTVRQKVMTKPDHMYLTALNKENAIKKFGNTIAKQLGLKKSDFNL